MSTNLRQLAIRGILWSGAGRVVIQALTWGMTIAVARVLSPSDYGLFGMAMLYIGFVESLNELGLGAAIIQRKEMTDRQLASLFWFTNAVGLLFYGFTILVAPLVASFFAAPLVIDLLWFLGLFHVISSLRQVPWSLLTRDVAFQKRSAIETSSMLVAGVVTIVLAWRGWGAWALAWGAMARSILITVLAFRCGGWRPAMIFHWGDIRPLVGFGTTAVAAQVVHSACDGAPYLIVGKMLGDHALGLYGLATRLTTGLSDRLLSVINPVTFPVYSKLQDQSERLTRYFLISVEMVSLVSFPLLGGLLLVADDAIPLLLGTQWLPLIGPFKVLAVAGVFTTLYDLTGPSTFARGGPRPVLRLNLLYLAVLPASFFVGTTWGLVGLCFVWVTIFPILAVYWISQHRRLLEYSWEDFRQALSPATWGTLVMVATVTAARLTLLTSLPPASRLAATCLLGALIYGAICRLHPSRPLKRLAGILFKSRPSRGPEFRT